MQIRTIINHDCEWCRSFAEELPEKFSGGKLLYAGRNEIRRFQIDGRTVVVKRFGRMNLIKKIIYTFFRKNKAIRSYRNSEELLRRGFNTPLPIAYVETRKGGLLDELYYVSAETKAKDVKSALIDLEPYNVDLLKAYAKFVASLHDDGVLHRDLNPTNVLYERDENGKYSFTLIDVNRMTFYNGPVPKDECMENLTLFWWLTPVYRAILDIYADQRGWTKDDIQQAIHVKKVHDRNWVRRKRITHLFKKKKN